MGRWRVDANARTATDGAVVRRLSPRATELLAVLAEAEGDVVTRAELLDAVWPNVTVGDESLTQAVAELRRAFGERRGSTRIIETIAKRGYRLGVPVLRDAGPERAPRETEVDAFDLDAYLLCLEARRTMARSGKDAVGRSEALSREAVRRAPRFALAHAEYAIALAFRGLYRDCRNEGDALATSLEHAENAARLRPDLAVAHAARGFSLGALGRSDAAFGAFATALSLDDRDAEIHFLCARTHFTVGDHLSATILAERAASLCPDDFQALFLAGRATVTDPGRMRKNISACHTRLEARLAIDAGEPRALNALGPILALAGKTDAARAALEAERDQGSVLEFYNVVAEVAMGELDKALDTLEAVVEAGWRHGDWLRAEPTLLRLRREPRYRRIERALVAA